MAGDDVSGGGPSVYCNKCGELHALIDCVRRNADHLILCCPNEDCGVVWYEYTARPPIAEFVKVNNVELPPFMIRSTAMRGSSTAADDDTTWPDS